MARGKKADKIINTEVITEEATNIVPMNSPEVSDQPVADQEPVWVPMDESAPVVAEPKFEKLERANRISVKSDGTGFIASFYRTHKHLADLHSLDTIFTPDEGLNKTAQREAFRLYAIDRASAVNVVWDPKDLRLTSNKRPNKYSSDEDIAVDAVELIRSDVLGFTAGIKSQYTLSVADIAMDDITARIKTPKGIDLADLHIYGGKYLSGNWAWADISMLVTIKISVEPDVSTEVYLTLDMALVSGQLKKPSNIGDMGWNQTAFTKAIEMEMRNAGLIKEEEVPTEVSDK